MATDAICVEQRLPTSTRFAGREWRSQVSSKTDTMAFLEAVESVFTGDAFLHLEVPILERQKMEYKHPMSRAFRFFHIYAKNGT